MATSTNAYGGHGPLILGVTWSAAIIATTLVVLRAFFARSRAGKIRWDFILVSISLVFALASQALLVLGVLEGIGNHIWKLPIANDYKILKLTYVGILLGLAAGNASKLAVIALLLQLTPDIDPLRRNLLWGLGIFLTGTYFVLEMIIVFQCHPFTYLWHPVGQGACPGVKVSNTFSYFQGAVTIIADLFLALYPTTILWNLRMSKRKKIGVCVIMAGGVCTAVISAARIFYEYRLFVSVDASYQYTPFILTGTLETWLVIILGSLPPLRAFFTRLLWPERQATNNASGVRLVLKTIGSNQAKVSATDTDLDTDEPPVEAV